MSPETYFVGKIITLKDSISSFNCLFWCKIPQHALQMNGKVIYLAETWFRYFLTAALKLH